MSTDLSRFTKLAFFDITSGDVNYPNPSAGAYARSGVETTFGYNPVVSAITLAQDASLTPAQKAIAVQMLADATRRSQSSFGFTTPDLIRAGIGAGLGYGAAKVTGKVLGAVFGLAPESQKQLSTIGAVGGLLRATGVWR
mgnify:CR=1 FL=1